MWNIVEQIKIADSIIRREVRKSTIYKYYVMRWEQFIFDMSRKDSTRQPIYGLSAHF